MANKNDEFLKKLLATFRVEADEHLQAISSGLLALENMPDGAQQAALVETVFREAHSLKGAARAVNLIEIESVCQSLESVLAALKGKRLAVSPPLVDLLQQAIDVLDGLLAPDTGPSPSRSSAVTALMRRLDDASTGTSPAPEASAPMPPVEETPTALPDASRAASTATHSSPPAPDSAADTVRISTARLDAVMRQVEELLSPRLAASQRVRELRETTVALTAWKKERARIQPVLRQVEHAFTRKLKDNGGAREKQDIPRLLEYLDTEQLHMKMLDDRLTKLKRTAEHDQRMLSGMTDGLLHDVKEMQLLPFTSLLDTFPRFARELARGQGKEMELAIRGGEIEIDRRILDAMKDPLIHLLRNAIDHGIEQPKTRVDQGKPPRGTITLTISQQDGGKIEVLVADDGAGIDASGVKAAAGKLGIVSAEEAERLDEPSAQALVFQSGVTTSSIITDVSGRGLGLAIVREKVERLDGSVTLESQPGTGTAFRIVLPLTLATFRGVLVRAGGQLCLIPAARIERVTRVNSQDIQTVENRETIPLDGQAVALTRLGDVLELPRREMAEEPADGVPAVVLGSDHTHVAFLVDEILGEQEVLVKTLGPQLARVRNVAGASVLGTGQVVPVLNVPDLLKSAVKQATAPRTPIAAGKAIVAEKRFILVVEDSITSRALLKNILESADYAVSTAVDGIDAYTALKTGTFDLVVSDVEMPRMDGFDLTAKIRADKQLAELPVVLVTALDSREHRERGIDAGANAYIVKSSFDQSNLLEVIRRLI